MRAVLAATVALILAACSSSGVSPSGTTVVATDAATASAAGPTSPAEGIAKLGCPAAFLEQCTEAVVAAAAVDLPSALCVFPGDRWAVVTPASDARPGSPCGDEGLGTIRGIIVAP